MIDQDAKAQAIAEILNGRVVQDKERVAICVKGSMLGFPAIFEAIYPNWPFGVTYTIQTEVDTSAPKDRDPLRLGVYPRMGRGWWTIFTRVLLLEAKGQSVKDKQLEKIFNFTYDNAAEAERFVKYPGVPELLKHLESTLKFSELIVRSGHGIYLTQSTSFNALDLDVCRGTFRTAAELGQVLFDAF